MPQLDEAPHFEGWEILEKLGEGGMCSVWRARPVEGGPERAIKTLIDNADQAVERFAFEARLLQRIDHPNVLRIESLHAEDRPPWIVMELLAGRDLEELRRLGGPMDPERAARIIADVANGLTRVHEMGVRHRDIKPANIMLGQDGVPRLIDFGIARETRKAHTTQQGFVVGTASYLPPEIFLEDDPQEIQDTEQADVYALGQTLCEILIGRVMYPTEGDLMVSMGQIMKDKINRPHLDPQEWRKQVPAGLARIVKEATAQEPEDRTQSAAELEVQLRDWMAAREAGESAPLSAIDIASLPPPPVTPAPAPRRPAPAKKAPRKKQPPTAKKTQWDITPLRAPSPTPTPPPSPTSAPPPSRGRAAGTAAASAVATGLVVVGYLLIGGLGIAALVQWAPATATGDPGPAIHAALSAQGDDLAECFAPEASGSATLSVDLRSGKKVQVVEGALAQEAVDCLTPKILALAGEHAPDQTVLLPIHLR